jgi:GMP synthase (glutamine-hydrolysing)
MSTFFIITHEEDTFDQLAEAIKEAGHEFLVYRRRLENQPKFDAAKHAGLIVLGDDQAESENECYDEERGWIDQAVDANLPILGICHGATLLSTRLGGIEQQSTKYADKGIVELYFTREGVLDPVIAPLLNQPFVFQHHWHTHTVPARGELLAVSSNPKRSHCEAFRFGKRIYAFQFHPEVSPRSFRMEKWFPREASDDRLEEVCATGKAVLAAWLAIVT